MEQFPIIRLTIEEMKLSILHHFNAYQKEVSDAIQQEMEKTIKNFDFASAVKKATADILTEKIESYFKFGEGSKLIGDAINETLNNTFRKKDEGNKETKVSC